MRSLELRFSTRELALGVCCIAWLTAAIKSETFLVIDGANDSSAASRHKRAFSASRQPELDREEYQSVGQSLRVSHLKLERKPASRPVDFQGYPQRTNAMCK